MKFFVYIGFVCYILLCVIGVGFSQYQYFDTGSIGEYQQGCTESIQIKMNTDGEDVGSAKTVLLLDSSKINYETSLLPNSLKTNLIPLTLNSFNLFIVPGGTSTNPYWNTGYDVGSYEALASQVKNSDNSYENGDKSIYNVIFNGKYNITGYDVDFAFHYDSIAPYDYATTLYRESTSTDVINASSQNTNLTGTISVLRGPCNIDNISPEITDNNYTNLTTKISNQGLNIDIEEFIGSGEVPFVRRNGQPGSGTWTGDYAGNTWGINNQYGVDSGTINITVAGNNQSIVLIHNDFDWTVIGPKTWHYLDRDYNVIATGGQLFDFGVEKQMTITYLVEDRLGNAANRYISFNHPVDAEVSNLYPTDNQAYVVVDEDVSFKITDDWAGVDSGSVVVTLSGLDNNYFGIYSGTDLNFSGVVGQANFLDYDVVLNHSDFPASGTIEVSVQGTDLENNGGVLATWTFSTAPTCTDLGCCGDIVLSGRSFNFIYPTTGLYVSGGINAFLTGDMGSTGYIDCNTRDEGLSIYKGHGDNNTGVFMGFTDLSKLIFQGTNVKAVLSGNTILLTKIPIPSGGGGGGTLTKDNCPDGDNSPSYYDDSCDGGSHGGADICNVDKSNYSNELKGAYLYSYAYNITTMCPVQDANLDGYLQRNHFAKMVSEFAVNVLGREPNMSKAGCDNFDDIDGDTKEMKGFMKIACELELMGLHADGVTPKKSFNPSGYVTRAEFGTVFSRLLFGNKYNVTDESQIFLNEGYRYKAHLNVLKENRIMTKIDGDWPNRLEKRGYVMLMMQRSDNYGIFAGKIPVLNGIKALFD